MKIEKCCKHYPTLMGTNDAYYRKGKLIRTLSIFKELFFIQDEFNGNLPNPSAHYYWELTCVYCDRFVTVSVADGDKTTFIQEWNNKVKVLKDEN